MVKKIRVIEEKPAEEEAPETSMMEMANLLIFLLFIKLDF